MLWLSTLLLGQSQELDPQVVQVLVDAAMKVVGLGSGGSVLLLGVAYFAREWLRDRKREAGNDPEHAAKKETRSRIEALGESQERISEHIENTAKIQERMLDELSAMRRESYQAHADIKAALRSGRGV